MLSRLFSIYPNYIKFKNIIVYLNVINDCIERQCKMIKDMNVLFKKNNGNKLVYHSVYKDRQQFKDANAKKYKNL